MGALLSRLSRCADRPVPGLRLFEPAPRFLLGELGDVSGLVLPPSEGLQGAVAHRRGDPQARVRLPVWARVRGFAGVCEVQDSLEKLHKYIAKHFRPIRNEVAGRAVASSVSPVLITKILMGTLGCVPAYDRFFQDGVATYKVTTREYSLDSVLRLVDFYEEHNDRLEDARRGMQCEDLTYPQMKLLDMGFWQVGFEKDAGSAK